jgi:hypothetical protein
MLLLGEELAPLASLNQVLGVSQGGRPVEARPEGFSHQVGGGCVIAALSTVDLL